MQSESWADPVATSTAAGRGRRVTRTCHPAVRPSSGARNPQPAPDSLRIDHVDDVLGRFGDAIRTGDNATNGFSAAAGPEGHVREAVITRVQIQAVSSDVGNRLGFKLREFTPPENPVVGSWSRAWARS